MPIKQSCFLHIRIDDYYCIIATTAHNIFRRTKQHESSLLRESLQLHRRSANHLHLHHWSVVTTPYRHVIDGTKPHGSGLIGGMVHRTTYHHGSSYSACAQYLYLLAYGNKVKHSRYHRHHHQQYVNLEYQKHRQEVSYQTVLLQQHGNKGIAIIRDST